MKFVIEQIALRPANRDRAAKLLAALGAVNWVHDRVVAEGFVGPQRSVEPGALPTVNVADLSFNYEMGPTKALEVELLSYRAGDNWLADSDNSLVSHLGVHCAEADLANVARIMRNFDAPCVQDVITTSHTNPAIKDTRRYRYVIYRTRPILGADLKFIVRREVPPALMPVNSGPGAPIGEA